MVRIIADQQKQNGAEDIKASSIAEAKNLGDHEIAKAGAIKKKILDEASDVSVQIENSKEELSGLVSRIEQKQSEKARAEQDLATFTLHSSETKSKINSEISSLGEEETSLKKRISILTEDLSDLSLKKIEIENQIRVLESSLLSLEEKKSSVEKLIVSAQADLVKCATFVEEKRSDISRLEQSISDRKDELNKLDGKKSEFTKVGKEIETAQKDLEAVKGKISEQHALLLELKTKEQEQSESAAARLRTIAEAEERLKNRLEFANRVIEKAKQDKLLKGDFSL